MKKVLLPLFLFPISLPVNAVKEIPKFYFDFRANPLVTLRNSFDFVSFWSPILMVIEVFGFAMTFWESLVARMIAFLVNLFFGRSYDLLKKKMLTQGISVGRYKITSSYLMLVAKIQINMIVYGGKAITGHHVDLNSFILKVGIVSLIAVISSFPTRKLFAVLRKFLRFKIFVNIKNKVIRYNPAFTVKIVEFKEYGLPPYAMFVHFIWIPIFNRCIPELVDYDREHMADLLSQ